MVAETDEELVYWGGDGHSNKSTNKYVTASGNKCQEGKKEDVRMENAWRQCV